MSAPLERLTAALSDRYRVDRELGAGGGKLDTLPLASKVLSYARFSLAGRPVDGIYLVRNGHA